MALSMSHVHLVAVPSQRHVVSLLHHALVCSMVAWSIVQLLSHPKHGPNRDAPSHSRRRALSPSLSFALM